MINISSAVKLSIAKLALNGLKCNIRNSLSKLTHFSSQGLGWTDPDYLPKPPSTLDLPPPPRTPLVLKCAMSTPTTPTTASTVGTPFITEGKLSHTQ